MNSERFEGTDEASEKLGTKEELQSFLHYGANISIRLLDFDKSFIAFTEGFKKQGIKGVPLGLVGSLDSLGCQFKIVPYSQYKKDKVSSESDGVSKECKKSKRELNWGGFGGSSSAE